MCVFARTAANKDEAYKKTFYAEPEIGLGEGSVVDTLKLN